MRLLEKKRKTSGAALSFVVGVIFIFMALGIAFFFMLRLLSGSKQVANATDAGVLNAAQQTLNVGLSSTQVSSLPILFQSLGVDLSTGQTAGLTTNSSGNYVPGTNATFDLLALNNMGISAAIIAQNAAEENTHAALSNANALIYAYTQAANQLTTELASSTALASAVGSMSGQNSVNMLGHTTANFLADSSTSNGLDYEYVPVPNAATNVYFPASFTQNDPSFASMVSSVSSGSKAASGDALINGYTPLKIDLNTEGTSQSISPIYLTPIANQTHLVATEIASQYSTIKNNTAPPNTVTGRTQATAFGGSLSGTDGTQHQGGGPIGGGSSTSNTAVMAIASAIVGSTAQIAASIPTGYIEITNLPDAVTVNPSLTAIPDPSSTTGYSTSMPGVIYQLNDMDSMFNEELWEGTGGLGGVFLAGYDPTTNLLYNTTTLVSQGAYATIKWDPKFGSSPAADYDGETEINAWIAYDQSSGGDQYNHNGALNPSILANGILDYASPSANVRSGWSGQATLSTMLSLAGANTYFCDTSSPDFGPDTTTQATLPGAINMGVMNSNYYGSSNTVGPALSKNAIQAYDSGAFTTGGLTNLEWLKAYVVTEWFVIWYNEVYPPVPGTVYPTSFTAKAPSSGCSGARVYDRTDSTGYACPSNTPNGIMAFGTTSTPYNLINNQLYAYGNASCSNMSDTTSSASPWNDTATPLGALLQRCQEICPSTTAANVITLLQTDTLDLGQTLYIYAGSSGLTISTSLPPWVSKASTPDGIGLAACTNDSWTDTIGTVIDSKILDGTTTNADGTTNLAKANKAGDNDTHDQPFEITSGTISTQDGMIFTTSSGYSSTYRDNLLGVLMFYNSTSGSATFSNPN